MVSKDIKNKNKFLKREITFKEIGGNMLRPLFKNKKAQNTAEYALLIALVIAGVVAMQTYAQRSLQARMRDAAAYMTQQTNGIGNSTQYEPYYVNTSFEVNRDSESVKRLAEGTTAMDSTTNRQRNGYEVTGYSVNSQHIDN